MSDLQATLRDLRRKIGDLEVLTMEGYRVRSDVLVILFNAEHAATETTPRSPAEHAATEGVPRFPKGTPEYEAYRAELQVELDKFASGKDPYPFRCMNTRPEGADQ